MIRIISVVAAFACLAACGGGSDCAKLNDQYARIFVSGSTCSSTQNGATITTNKPASTEASCDASYAKCTATDKTAISDYEKCLESVPACTAGNESNSSGALIACAFGHTASVSADCAAGLK